MAVAWGSTDSLCPCAVSDPHYPACEAACARNAHETLYPRSAGADADWGGKDSLVPLGYVSQGMEYDSQGTSAEFNSGFHWIKSLDQIRSGAGT